MAINNKTWTADEEITYSKLNQMSADIVNGVDELHKQYNPHFYSGQLVEVVANSTSGQWYRRSADNARTDIVESVKFPETGVSSIVKVAASIHLNLLPGHTFTAVKFAYKLCLVAGGGGTRQGGHFVAQNGTSRARVLQTPTAVFTSWDSYTATVSLTAPAAGDVIDAGIFLYAVNNDPSAIVCVKDIEIYLS